MVEMVSRCPAGGIAERPHPAHVAGVSARCVRLEW
jgi:hypothetical protein